MNSCNLLSVIMPVYNTEKYLKESIESILNQSYKDFEFIIINDGSTDNSLNIINNYAQLDGRIKVISRENKGLVYSLNEGLNIAKGKYVARMDADDVSLPERLKKQVDFLEKHKEIDILATKASVIGDATEVIKSKNEEKLNMLFKSEDARKILLNYWYCLAHPSIMFRKSILEKLQGYKEYKSEDLDLWLRALKANFKIYKLNEKLIEYRIHKESKSNKDNEKFEGLKDGIKIKLNDVFGSEIKSDFRYVIWGASNGGRITKEIANNYFKDSKCAGFIDKFKEGKFEDSTIFKPEQINDIGFDYVFIATEPGKEEAINKLENIGLKSIDDFLCTV